MSDLNSGVSGDEPETSRSGKLSRRTLIGGMAVVGLVASGFAARMAVRSSARLEEFFQPRRRAAALIDLAHAEIDQWRAMVGRTFNVSGYQLRLSGVAPLAGGGERPSNLRQQGFVAVFDAPGRQTLPGDLLFSISGPQTTSFTIFLSNAGNRVRPGRMHAIFN